MICTYPRCNCPFDAPADPNWCARGLPHAHQAEAFEQMRRAFEAWLNPGNHAGNVSPWVAPGRYEKESHQLAWLSWRARALQADPRVDDLATLVARLAHSLKKAKLDSDLPAKAMDYLHRHDLTPSPFRADPTCQR